MTCSQWELSGSLSGIQAPQLGFLTLSKFLLKFNVTVYLLLLFLEYVAKNKLNPISFNPQAPLHRLSRRSLTLFIFSWFWRFYRGRMSIKTWKQGSSDQMWLKISSQRRKDANKTVLYGEERCLINFIGLSIWLKVGQQWDTLWQYDEIGENYSKSRIISELEKAHRGMD